MKVWLVQVKGTEDDFGSYSEETFAVCTTEARARELAGGMWGHKGPGLPMDVRIEEAKTDTFLVDNETAGI